MCKVSTLVLLITESYDRSLRFKNHDLKVKVLKLTTTMLIQVEIDNNGINRFISLPRLINSKIN